MDRQQNTLDAYADRRAELAEEAENEEAVKTLVKQIDWAKVQPRVYQSASAQAAATTKQLEYLRDLGVKVPQGLTKLQASELLDKAIAARRAA